MIVFLQCKTSKDPHLGLACSTNTSTIYIYIIYNVLTDELFSKAWCELIFEGRNKEYGAYRLRRSAGRRYRFAMLCVLGIAGLLSAWQLTTMAVTYISLHGLEGEMPMAKLKPMEVEPDHELKAMAAGRTAPHPVVQATATVVDDVTTEPEIVDAVPPHLEMGEPGPEELKIDEEVFVKIPEDTVRINEDRKDLPVEAAPLTPTEVVEEMPQFPGGWYALKRYLDEHVPYPKGCIDRRIQGDVEVAFYVDQNGGVLEPKVTKSVHPELDAAALQGIKGMPQWTPGRRNGKVTIVRIRIPVHFEYQSSEFKL